MSNITKCDKRQSGLFCFKGGLITNILIYQINLAKKKKVWYNKNMEKKLRTNAVKMSPEEQRATLVSIESFSFSVIMIVLSPLAGFVFTYW